MGAIGPPSETTSSTKKTAETLANVAGGVTTKRPRRPRSRARGLLRALQAPNCVVTVEVRVLEQVGRRSNVRSSACCGARSIFA
jgi:hypothetical protein